jgi:hypothetical protein
VEEWADRSVLEAASWRLASELYRRHPDSLRRIRGHPGGGQYDLLWLLALSGDGGQIMLNRNGIIQVSGRFDGKEMPEQWRPTEWEDYLRRDPFEFVTALEHAVGLPRPSSAPPSTPTSLTYRVIAALAAMHVKSVDPVVIEQGFIDSSGEGGGPNELLDRFPISDALLARRPDDLFGEPGYRFWFVVRGDDPLLGFEQTEGRAWVFDTGAELSLMSLYQAAGRRILPTTIDLVRDLPER